MKFEDWWTEERDKHGKEYVMLGPMALRKVALCAWEEGQSAVEDVPKYTIIVVCKECKKKSKIKIMDDKV